MSSQSAAVSGTSHRRRFGLLYVALGLVIVTALATFPSEEKSISRSVLAVAHPTPGSSIVATLEKNKLHGMQDETLTLEATTPPGTVIDSMVICTSAPELAPEPSGCVPIKVYRKSDIATKRIPTIVHLHPTNSFGTEKVLITASWLRYVPVKNPASRSKTKLGIRALSCEEMLAGCHPLSEKMFMTVGPVDLGVDKLSRFAGRLSRFIKDLTLPILLLIIANWLTREAAERDRKREANEKQVRDTKEFNEKQFDDSRRKSEREQEEQKQIAHILLPKVMRLSGHYYLPIVSNLTWFLRVSATTVEDTGELLFYLLSFFHVARSLKEKEGGIFFQDIAAEQMFTIVNNTIRGVVVAACGGERAYTDTLDFLDTWVPPEQRRWPRFGERPTVVPQTWKNLEIWLSAIDAPQLEAIRYLFNILAATMRYESNVPYAHWYINSSRENLFKLPEKVTAPAILVFGPEIASDVQEFLALSTAYRLGKEQ